MFHTIKENIFIILATVFLGVALTFSFTAYGQTSGECEACGGEPNNGGDCYAVNIGAMDCWETSVGCSDTGNDCDKGFPIVD